MAIYHLSVQVISRSKGRSAVAAAAYRSGERLRDERTGLLHDYTYLRREGEIEAWIQAPAEVPDWARDREDLWNRVEACEQRKDSQLARNLNIALPVELSRERQRELIRGYVEEQFIKRGMVADVSLHFSNAHNPYAEVMLSTRKLELEGFGLKVREWSSRQLLYEWRESWAHHANRQLEDAGSSARIDHRSLEAQGIDRLPTMHEGRGVRAMQARGIRTERGDYNRETRSHNLLGTQPDEGYREMEGQVR